MNKNGLKDWLFELFNEHDSLFSDISTDDGADTLFVKSADGQMFSITVNAITDDEALLNIWAKKNPGYTSVALGILNLRDLDALTAEEFEQYLSAVIERSDTSGIDNVKDMLENLSRNK